MVTRFLYGSGVFALAFAILLISFLESASVKYAFAVAPATPSPNGQGVSHEINYTLPFPGSTLPGSILWPIKALRDQIWLWTTTNSTKRAELALLFADKRIAMSKILFDEKKADIGFSTLTKAEKYLELAVNLEEGARKSGSDTTNLLQKISLASIKHRQVIEEILSVAPDDAKPGIIKLESYSRDAYILCKVGLNAKGIASPINPFNWQ